jgi:DNA-binding transcriptional LysR family regulator
LPGSERDEELEALRARNDELRRLLAEAYRRLEELEGTRGHGKRRLGATHAGVRRVVRTRAPALARLYRNVRVRLG